MDWWQKLMQWEEKMSEKYNVHVEVHDATRINKKKGIYLVKLDVYPWGTTSVEGTLEELEKFVKTIVEEEINPPNYSCPFCGTSYSLRELDGEVFLCKCGAKLFKAFCTSSTPTHDNSAFRQIEELLTPFEKEQVELFIFKNHFLVEDVFKNVKFDWINRKQGYWIKGEKPIVRKEYEIQELRPIECRLIKEGYEFLEGDWSCSVWINEEEHEIGLEYEDVKPGKPVRYYSVWIEVEGILTTNKIWNFQDLTEADYGEEISQMLGGELTWFRCKDASFDALSVKPEEFLNANLQELKRQLEEKFSSAQLKVLKKYNLKPEDLEE